MSLLYLFTRLGKYRLIKYCLKQNKRHLPPSEMYNCYNLLYSIRSVFGFADINSQASESVSEAKKVDGRIPRQNFMANCLLRLDMIL